MKLLDYLNLVSNFDDSTIKIRTTLLPANSDTKPVHFEHKLILDTGADTTALTREFLKKSGYGVYNKSGKMKSTATGEVELLTCEINGLILANQFKFGKMKVDVLENWKAHTVVGVIGMDILSRLTFILSHEHKKFLLSAQVIPELAKLFG
jgi:predicted aspartyl protease